jgi:hypothetical protein
VSVFDAGCCCGEIGFWCRSLCVCFFYSGVFHELLSDIDFAFGCWIYWGRQRHSSLSVSHIADNDIGDEGCIALSSSLVHLSHLKELWLDSECF